MGIKNSDNEVGNRGKIVLPYIQGATDRIYKVLKMKRIKTDFSPLNSLKNFLDKTKDPVDTKIKKGVYSIPYSCGKIFVNEMGCSIKVRLKEHCVAITHNRTKSLVVEKHSHNHNHYICMEHAKVISTEEHNNKRSIREIVEIEKHPGKFNRDYDFFLGDS